MVRKIVLCAVVGAAGLLAGCGGKEQEPAPVAVEAQTVEIISEDSVKLVGTWFGVPNSRAAIVCLPALTHSRGTWASTAQQFAASGWSVLTVDLRDQGDSQMPVNAPPVWVGNDTLRALAYYIKDVKAAVAFVRSKAPARRWSFWERELAGTADCMKLLPTRRSPRSRCSPLLSPAGLRRPPSWPNTATAPW
ncbi:MAG TPA: hypothetical protein PLE60_10800 [Candidatus Latescibacteria bacterium]|nr:hypothetical protein [Candidatus Latescibacterota bacterium]